MSISETFKKYLLNTLNEDEDLYFTELRNPAQKRDASRKKQKKKKSYLFSLKIIYRTHINT